MLLGICSDGYHFAPRVHFAASSSSVTRHDDRSVSTNIALSFANAVISKMVQDPFGRKRLVLQGLADKCGDID